MRESELFKAGRALGARLLEEARTQLTARQKAEEFVAGIFAGNPKIKAPALTQNQEMKRWMVENDVTEGHVREALTAARRKARAAGGSEGAIQRPKKKRSRDQAKEADQAPRAGHAKDPEPQSSAASRSRRHEARVVSDKPLDELIPE